METLEDKIKNNLSPEDLKQFNKIYYGREDHCEILIQESTLKRCKDINLQIAGYSFSAAKEELRETRISKIGLVQNSIVLSTQETPVEQRKAIHEKVQKIIEIAACENVQILCLQEAWSMPFFLCTEEKEKWSEFVEDARNGPSTKMLGVLAKRHQMVIISPILEKDDNGTWWNTAVVINEKGEYMGKHRKNHLPSIGSFSETSFYAPGNIGHPVFATKYGKIAINICYGRHQALSWLMFGRNGAEIVFNPSATVSEFGESFWTIEARNAAVANSFYTCSINRVGDENFSLMKDGIETEVSRSFYGSSYITAPNGCRTPTMSKVRDGLLVAEVDLNLCRQMKDQWGFNMTARLELYAESLRNHISGIHS